jgi:hypothetical protein
VALALLNLKRLVKNFYSNLLNTKKFTGIFEHDY